MMPPLFRLPRLLRFLSLFRPFLEAVTIPLAVGSAQSFAVALAPFSFARIFLFSAVAFSPLLPELRSRKSKSVSHPLAPRPLYPSEILHRGH